MKNLQVAKQVKSVGLNLIYWIIVDAEKTQASDVLERICWYFCNHVVAKVDVFKSLQVIKNASRNVLQKIVVKF